MPQSQHVLDPGLAGGLTVEVAGGAPSRVRLAGELDYGTAPRLRAALARLGGADCVIDCSDLTFIDSLGIGVLVRYSVAFAHRHERLVLVDLRDWVRRTLEVSGVIDRFEIEESAGPSTPSS
jgi:stage II sporulation protein AA (anti-sigma F factor antagonist)